MGDRGIRTLIESNQYHNNLYLLLPTQTLGIIKDSNWLAQCQDNLVEWDIRSCRRVDIDVDNCSLLLARLTGACYFTDMYSTAGQTDTYHGSSISRTHSTVVAHRVTQQVTMG